jgi:hypothetical protein
LKSRREQEIRQDVAQKEEHGKKLRRGKRSEKIQTERSGCQITHIQWKCSRKKPENHTNHPPLMFTTSTLEVSPKMHRRYLCYSKS